MNLKNQSFLISIVFLIINLIIFAIPTKEVTEFYTILTCITFFILTNNSNGGAANAFILIYTLCIIVGYLNYKFYPNKFWLIVLILVYLISLPIIHIDVSKFWNNNYYISLQFKITVSLSQVSLT